MERFDVVVIGAGAAGLAAARALSTQGLSVAIVEARDRIGGRIATVRPPGGGLPVELGAEFVHGMPKEILGIAQAAGLTLYELDGERLVSADGHPHVENEAGEDDDENEGLEAILQAIREWDGADVQFQAFLHARFPGEHWAAAWRATSRYVEGFDAADTTQVGVRWLAQTEAAADAIQGERQFRVLDGYDRVLEWLRAGLDPSRTALQLHTVAHEIQWSRRAVEVAVRSPLGAALAPIAGRACVVTLPLGVLKAPLGAPGTVRFVPDLPEKREAMECVEMGQAMKVLLRFREVFWETGGASGVQLPALPKLSFLLSDDDVMPTWWTSYPLMAPILTGWVGGPRAAQLAGQADTLIVEQALDALARVLGVRRGVLEAQLDGWMLHNWSTDPYARGAYSYGRVGGLDAPAALGASVVDTLFFAGEATDTTGYTGTVHGALASGMRAAGEVLAQVSKWHI